MKRGRKRIILDSVMLTCEAPEDEKCVRIKADLDCVEADCRHLRVERIRSELPPSLHARYFIARTKKGGEKGPMGWLDSVKDGLDALVRSAGTVIAFCVASVAGLWFLTFVIEIVVTLISMIP